MTGQHQVARKGSSPFLRAGPLSNGSPSATGAGCAFFQVAPGPAALRAGAPPASRRGAPTGVPPDSTGGRDRPAGAGSAAGLEPATRRILTVLLTWTLAATPARPADGVVQGEPPSDVPQSRGITLAEPDLDSMEPAVRRQLAEARAAVAALEQRPGTPDAELAEAAGGLGRLYFLYGLEGVAEQAFEAARRLAPGDARWPYYLGVIAQDLGRLETAVERFREVLELRPGDPPSLVRLGRLELARHRPAEAADYFRRALERAPRLAAARAGMGQAAVLAGDPATAVEQFEAALALDPGLAGVRYPLGLAYRELGELERARHHLAARRGGRPAFPDPLIDQLPALARGASFHIFYGAQASLAGDLEGAVERYRQALAADPESVMARRALASALARRDDPAAAAEEYRRVLAAEPGNAAVRVELATLLAGGGAYEEAAAELRRALEDDPASFKAHLGLAVAAQRLDRPDEAEEHLAAALAIDPHHELARLEQARLLTRRERYAEAAATLRAVLAANPENSEARLGLAALRRRLEGPEAALEEYEALLAGRPDPETAGLAHLESGRLLLERGDPAPALDHLEKAAAALPPTAQLLSTLAGLQARAGRFGEAVASFDRLLALEPAAEPAHFGRALALLLDERCVEARERLEESTERLPGSLELRHALARLLATCPDAAARDGARALALAEEVFRQQQTLEHAETLAMAYAELGRFAEAVEWQRRILAESGRRGATARLGVLEARLAAYERGEPCRAPWLEGG